MIKKMMLVLMLVIVAVLFIAAKPTPDTIPEMVECTTHAQKAQVLAGTEPFCRDKTHNFLLQVPIRENHHGWYFQMEIYNSSFEPTEICDGDFYLGYQWYYAHPIARPYLYPHEFVPEHCEDGTFFLEIRWEERDPDTGNVDYYETFIRRWERPEEDK